MRLNAVGQVDADQYCFHRAPEIVCVLVVALYAAASVIDAAAVYTVIEEIAGLIDRMAHIRIVIGSAVVLCVSVILVHAEPSLRSDILGLVKVRHNAGERDDV